MRVLLANEFGQGSGHILLIKGIVENVRAIEPDAVFRILMPAHYARKSEKLEGLDTQFPPAIAHFSPTERKLGATNFGEVIGSVFFDPMRTLAERFETWANEILDFKPDVIVADYAPSLLMYARRRWPTVHAGVGYTLPPPEAERFPDFRPRGLSKAPGETVLIEKINSALKAVSACPLEFLPQMNQADAYGLATIPIFDPYWRQRKQRYLGVLHPGGTPLPSLTCEAESIVVYMNCDAHSETVLAGLADTGYRVDAYFSRLGTGRLRSPTPRIVLKDKPFHLATDMPGRALALHGGTLGFASAAMFAGVPQVSLFDHDESQGNAAATVIAKIGLAAPRRNVSVRQITQMCVEATARSELRNFSVALSNHYANFRNVNPTVEIARLAVSLARDYASNSRT